MSKYRGKATVNKLFKLICSWKQNNVNLTGLLAILEKISESLASIAMYDKLAPICKVRKTGRLVSTKGCKFTLEYCNYLPSSTKVTFIVDQSRHMVQISPSTKRSRTSFVAGF